MTRYLKGPAIALLALTSLAPAAIAQRQVVIVRRPPVVVVNRPFFWGGYYDPWYPYGYYPYGYSYRAANVGEVKLKTEMKDAAVYVDGGYAGLAKDMKHFDLRAGTHDIELRNNDGRTIYSERVTVIAGKTTKIDAG